MQVSSLKGFYLSRYVRKQYKSYLMTSPKSLNYWVEMVFLPMLNISFKKLKKYIILIIEKKNTTQWETGDDNFIFNY